MNTLFCKAGKHASHVAKHLRKHGHKYAGGMFAGFAVVKAFVLLAGLIGSFSLFQHYASANFVDPTSACAGVTEIPQSECVALLNLYNSTDGDNRTDHTNRGDTGAICGSRFGITCTGGHVTDITLRSMMAGNNLTGTMSLSGLTQLQSIDLRYNHLSSVDFAGLTGLKRVQLGGNQISDVDLSGLIGLNYLDLSQDHLSSIDLNGLSALTQLGLGGNQFTNIDLSGLTNLQQLYLWNNQLSTIDLSATPNLAVIDLGGNHLTGIDLEGLTNLHYLNMADNQLSSIDVSGMTGLNYLYLARNNLSTIDLSATPNLAVIDLGGNHLTGIDLEGLTYNFQYLNVSNNLLTTIPEYFTGFTNLMNGNLFLGSNCRDTSSMSNDLISFLDTKAMTNNWENSINPSCPRPAFDCSNVTVIPQSECETLVALYDSTNGDSRSRKDNRFWITNISAWFGITVSDGHVTTINLGSNNLSGTADLTGLTDLQELHIDGNSLTGIDVSGLSSLTTFYGFGNQLVSSDLEGDVNLAQLALYNNQLSTIDLSGDTSLTNLALYNNQLTTIDLSGDTSLTSLSLYNNQLTGIDLSGLNNLQQLYLYSNQLTSIDLSGLTGLTALHLYNNQLTSIDLSGLTNLSQLSLYNNHLTSIDLSGLNNLLTLSLNNNRLTTLPESTTGLTNLMGAGMGLTLNYNCRDTSSMSNDLLTFLSNKVGGSMRQWSLNPSCPPAPPFDCSLVTDVPQSECEVLVNLYSGANGSNWNDHTNRLHSTTVGNRYGITVSDGHVTQINLAGYMHMGNGLIGTADFSGLDNLQQLFLDRNQLSSINIAGLTNLTYVFADDNQLTDFDLDGLTNLDDLNVDGNRLSILNLSGLTNLQTVYANTNNLTSIDLDGLSNLDRLGLNNNQISDIDLSGLTALQYLYLSSNQLSTVNLSGLNSLINLDLSYNLLSTLPESTLSLSHLAQVNLSYNCRNPSAMSDDLISFLNEYTPDTSWLVGGMNDTCPVPSLDCATVTDIPQNECEALVSLYTDTNGNHWTQRNNRLRSTTASNRYGVTVNDGHVNTINLPNNGLQGTLTLSGLDQLRYLNVSTNSLNGTLSLSGLDKLTDLNVSTNSLNAIDLGPSDLRTLDFSYNQITDVTLSGLNELTDLEGRTNQLSTIDLSGLTNLTTLSLGGNSLTTIDLAGLTNLTGIELSYNKIDTIDLSGLNNLQILNLQNNDLADIDIAGLNNLTVLALSSNGLSNIDLTGLSNLTELDLDSNDFSTVDLAGLSNLQYLNLGKNDFTNIDLSGLTNLQALHIGSNQLSTIDLGGLTDLTDLDLGNNQLTSIDLGGLMNLGGLSLDGNQLSTIDLGGLTKLGDLDLGNNQLTSIDLAGLTNLNNLNLNGNQLSTIDLDGLTNLQSINISSNQLSTIDLGGLTNLRSITINDNQLTSINLAGLSNLNALYLENNQLGTIDLDGINNLSYLDLGGNQLTSIDFDGLSNLSYLFLNNNHLTTIPENLANFPYLGYVGGLNVDYNSIDYSNFSQTLLDFIDSRNSPIDGDWRSTQQPTPPDDGHCGNGICESTGYCALDMAKTQAAANGCSNRTPDNCSNGCYVDTPAQVCDGKGVSCDSIVDQDTCNQFSCSWNKDKQSCSNGAGDIPPSCSQFDTNSCPTAYGCDIIQPDPVCTGTSDPTTITQDQCGMVPQYAYQGTWETEDSNSCPADCTDTPEGPTGELSNTVTGAGDLDGIVFSKSADVTGATVGDTINYTLHYENNSATNSDLGVMIKDYLPENLQILNASATGYYVDHEMTYGGTGDACFQQFLHSTGAYYQLLENTIQGAYGASLYQAATASLGYTGTEGDLGQFFYDNMCLGKGDTNLQDCFNEVDFGNAPQYNYPQLASVGPGCGVAGDELNQPYYYRYLGYVGTGESGDINFSAQVHSLPEGLGLNDNNGIGDQPEGVVPANDGIGDLGDQDGLVPRYFQYRGHMMQNIGEYFVNQIGRPNQYQEGKIDFTDEYSGLAVSLRTLITTVPDLAITKTLISKGPYLPGSQLQYQIDYANVGDLPLEKINIIDAPGNGLSLVDPDGVFTEGWGDRSYGVTGDRCYDDFLNETGVYVQALLSRLNGLGYTGSRYDYMLSSPNTAGFLDSPWDGQAYLAGDFMVSLLTQDGMSFSDAMYNNLTIDLSTLDPSCGTGGYPYYIPPVDDLTPGESGSIIVTMQVDPTLKAGDTITNVGVGIDSDVDLSNTDKGLEKNIDNNISMVSITLGSSDSHQDNGGGSNGGGGGGPPAVKDQCPAQRDCSDSYYDKLCGPCSLTDKIIQMLPFHSSADKPVASIVHSPYSTELNNAYLRAYNYDITTLPTIQQANINGTLIRKDMAKMISNFATNVLGKTISTGGTNCNFSDISSLSKESQYYAITACRLGLMGYASDGVTVNKTFAPNAKVDRAQFGTILSRLMRGSAYNGGNPYYQKHLNALKQSGIMTQISTPHENELRGRVMLMMQRVFKTK